MIVVALPTTMSDFQNDQNRSEILQSPINLTDRQHANFQNNNYDLNNNETFSLASLKEHNTSSESNINNQLVESDTNFNSSNVRNRLSEEKKMLVDSQHIIDDTLQEDDIHVCKLVVTIVAAFPAGLSISNGINTLTLTIFRF